MKTFLNFQYQNKKHLIICESMKTRNGFKHVAELYGTDSNYLGVAKSFYINRTWEEWQYKSVIFKLLNEVLNIDYDNATKIIFVWGVL
jgi:hypothetical protein